MFAPQLAPSLCRHARVLSVAPIFLGLLLGLGAAASGRFAGDSAWAEPAKPSGPQAGASLGDQVFRDRDNDGRFQASAGDRGIAGVLLHLYADDGDLPGRLDSGDRRLASQVSGASGQYRFSNLADGEYLIEVDPQNFVVGAALAGLVSADGNGIAPDPDDDQDLDDNADLQPGFGVATLAISLAAGSEPVSEDGDADSNLTLDLGFTAQLCIGDRIWEDLDDDGRFESGAGEPGIGGVQLELYRDAGDGLLDSGDRLVAEASSDEGSGNYRFCGLLPADYILLVPARNFEAGRPLAGLVSSRGGDLPDATAIDPDDDVDDDDNGYLLSGFGTASKAMTLIDGSEPLAGAGKIDNPSLDMGFSRLDAAIRLRKTLYLGEDGGAGCPGEDLIFAIDGLAVTWCFDITNVGALHLAALRVADAELGIDQDAMSLLSGTEPLAPGETMRWFYPWTVEGSLANTALAAGKPSDRAGQVHPGWADSEDRDDAMLISLPIETLPSGAGRLGDRVFLDLFEDGRFEPSAGEVGIDGVRMQLWFDVDQSGDLSAADIAGPSTISAGGGFYAIDDVGAGQYIVAVEASNFDPGGPLEGLRSSIGNDDASGRAPAPGNGVDHDDNGDEVPGFGVASMALIFLPGSAPTGEDGDADTDLTIDFGFASISPPTGCLGDRVFFDLDNDGLFDVTGGEFGLGGLQLELYADSNGSGDWDAGDAALAQQTSGSAGRYRFCGLVNGHYLLRIDPSEFGPGRVLDGLESSSGNDILGLAPDPDDDRDGDDNGMPDGAGGVVTRAVTLIVGSEPGVTVDGDGLESNATVDLGFMRREQPTGSGLREFRAEARGAEVLLRWWMPAQPAVVGFNLYRAAGCASPARLNAGLIPVENARAGSAYAFIDRPGVGIWTYWVEVIGSDGRRQGRASTVVDVPGLQRIWLPQLRR